MQEVASNNKNISNYIKLVCNWILTLSVKIKYHSSSSIKSLERSQQIMQTIERSQKIVQKICRPLDSPLNLVLLPALDRYPGVSHRILLQ